MFIHQAGSTFVTKEASLVPMFLLVRQILGVNTDDLAALVAVVGEHILVALDAVRVVIARGKMWYLFPCFRLTSTSLFQIRLIKHKMCMYRRT